MKFIIRGALSDGGLPKGRTTEEQALWSKTREGMLSVYTPAKGGRARHGAGPQLPEGGAVTLMDQFPIQKCKGDATCLRVLKRSCPLPFLEISKMVFKFPWQNNV